MEWVIERGDLPAVRLVRRFIAEYLRGFGVTSQEVESVELVVSELLTNAIVHTSGPVWVSLDWSAASPVLTVRDLGESFELTASLPAEPGAVGGRGLFIAAKAAGWLERRAAEMGGSEVTASLAVTRPPE